MKKAGGLLGLFMLFFLVPGAGFCDSCKVAVDKDSVKVGEEFNITIQAEIEGAQECSDLVFPSAGRHESVYLKNEQECRKDGSRFSKDYTAAVFSIKPNVGIDNLFVLYNGKTIICSGPDIAVSLETTEKDKEIMGIYDWFLARQRMWPVYLGLLLLVVSLGIAAFWMFRRKKEQESESEKRPYWEIAKEAVDEIAKKELVRSAKFRQFYYELTEVLRFFIKHRFAVDAMEMTPMEFIDVVNGIDAIDEKSREFIISICERSIPIKYAKDQAFDDVSAAMKDLEFTRHFIEAYTPKEPEDGQ